VKAGAADTTHMISAIDFMPTVLDIAGVKQPAGLQGRSFLPLLRGRSQDGRDHVIKEYNENAGGGRHPMRSVETRKYGYIFNPWSNGTRKFRTATQGTRTYKLMVQKAESDPAIAQRLKLFDYRTVEEFYDYDKDPDALHNRIGDPALRGEVDRLRKILEDWMVSTDDPCLEAFRNRDNPEALDRFVQEQQAASDERRRKARSGKKNAKPGARLIAIAKPGPVTRGGKAEVTIRHTLPADLGKQLLHVTAKRADGKRIDRKVLTIDGTGKVEVTFAIPDEAELQAVSYAAFVGKDFPGSLQHVTTKPLAVE
jgi:N-sulfoglucosamine sulfohydrolase